MWIIAKPNYIRRANLEGRTSVVEWVRDPHYPEFSTNLAAKRAYVEALEPERKGHGDDAIRRAFRVWANNWQHVKLLKV